MRKTLTAAMAAITLGGAVCATAAPAEARGYYHGGYGGHYYRHDNGGAVAAAGIVGLALGAALASDHGYRHSYGYGPYYSSYYGPAYYDYGPPVYRVCESERWVWDPYIGRRVPVRTRYAC